MFNKDMFAIDTGVLNVNTTFAVSPIDRFVSSNVIDCKYGYVSTINDRLCDWLSNGFDRLSVAFESFILSVRFMLLGSGSVTLVNMVKYQIDLSDVAVVFTRFIDKLFSDI